LLVSLPTGTFTLQDAPSFARRFVVHEQQAEKDMRTIKFNENRHNNTCLLNARC
jgi:hypothetical protein